MSAENIEEAIHEILVADATVKDLTTRCYPSTLPQDPTYPLILYMRVYGAGENALEGPVGMANPHFQIEAWAKTYAAAKALAKAVRNALNGFRGTSGTVPDRIVSDSIGTGCLRAGGSLSPDHHGLLDMA